MVLIKSLLGAVLAMAASVSAQAAPAALAATQLERMFAFKSPDFVFDFKKNLKTGPGGKVAKMDVSSLPSLRNQKLSMVLLEMVNKLSSKLRSYHFPNHDEIGTMWNQLASHPP
jgi:hypothetical protein